MRLVRLVRDDPVVRVLRALRPDPWRSTLAVLAGTGALGCAIALMATSGWLISRAAQQPPVLHLQVAVVATRAFGIGRGVLRYAERLVSHDVALRGVVDLREDLYRRLVAADPAVVAGLRRGDLLARLGADVDALADVVVRAILPFAVAATTLAATAIGIGLLLPAGGLLVAGAFAVAAVAAPWFAGRSAGRAERDGARARAELSAQVLGLLDALPELTVAGTVPDRLAAVAALDEELAATQDASARGASWASGIGTLATGLAMIGSLLLAVQAHAAGSLDAVLVAVVTLTPLAAAEAVAALPAAAVALVRGRSAAERVLALLDTPPGPGGTPSARSVAVPGAPPAAAPAPAPLRAEQLACGWPGRVPVLTGVDLDLAPGRRVALVGPSGGGKTTLLLTLAGLLPPRGGTVRLGRPLAELDEAALRRAVSFTAEDAHIFTTTVRENLRVADPGADDAALSAVLARAGLADWAADLPRGLDTMLGTGGRDVSGGERRRLLLARALLVGARVLLLDEVGEHLDPATADSLVEDLFRTRDGSGALGTGSGPSPAVMLVTHRLSPLVGADEVLVLDGGRLAARGRHQDLLARYPPYARALAAERA